MNDNEHNDGGLTVMQSFPFSPAAVYSAWVSSDAVIPPAKALAINPVVGGEYKLVTDFATAIGVFETVEPNRRLIYSWRWQTDPASTKIDVRFDADDSGALVTLHHSGFSNEDTRRMHEEGWRSYLAGLDAYLHGR